jgi:tetratricopeptide (TPR) repeat protein
MPSNSLEGIFFGDTMKKIWVVLAAFLFLCINICFAFEWKKLHEDADKISLAEAESLGKSGSKEGLYILGLVYLNEHKDKEAMEVFEKITSKDPRAYEAKWGIAEVLRRQHKLEESLKLLDGVIKTDPDFSPAYITLAYVKYTQMDFNAAVRFAVKVMNQGKAKVDLSNYVRAYLLYGGAKGVIAHHGGPLSKVINGTAVFSNLKKAEKLQPDSAAVKYSLGSFYLLAPGFVGGNLELAQDYLTKSVELDPLFANAYVRLAEVYKAKNDTEKYRQYLDKALEVDPGCELAQDVKNGTCKYSCYQGLDQ